MPLRFDGVWWVPHEARGPSYGNIIANSPSSRRTSGSRSINKADFNTCFCAPFFNGVTTIFMMEVRGPRYANIVLNAVYDLVFSSVKKAPLETGLDVIFFGSNFLTLTPKLHTFREPLQERFFRYACIVRSADNDRSFSGDKRCRAGIFTRWSWRAWWPWLSIVGC